MSMETAYQSQFDSHTFEYDPAGMPEFRAITTADLQQMANINALRQLATAGMVVEVAAQADAERRSGLGANVGWLVMNQTHGLAAGFGNTIGDTAVEAVRGLTV